MICLDTTFLVDLWRHSKDSSHGTQCLLDRNQGELFMVPAHAAGEFLEGGVSVSTDRLSESLSFLRLFAVGAVGLETAEHYARIVADLRARSLLVGLSKPDVWIAASAVEHGAALATRNAGHFGNVHNLELVPYEDG